MPVPSRPAASRQAMEIPARDERRQARCRRKQHRSAVPALERRCHNFKTNRVHFARFATREENAKAQNRRAGCGNYG